MDVLERERTLCCFRCYSNFELILEFQAKLRNFGKMNSRLLQNSRLPEDRTLVYQKLSF